jgi:hypothetical protein
LSICSGVLASLGPWEPRLVIRRKKAISNALGKHCKATLSPSPQNTQHAASTKTMCARHTQLSRWQHHYQRQLRNTRHQLSLTRRFAAGAGNVLTILTFRL